jgi:dsDNA-binding SOS-regulon protein
MKKKQVHLKSGLALLVLATFFCIAKPAGGQSAPAQNRAVQDNDTTRQEVANFDKFLDTHREIAEQLRKDPSLVNSREFAKNHPALQTYLQDHPAVREEIKENPNAFMRQEDRFDRREDNRNRDISRDRDTTRQELANFDKFLDNHRETAEQLRKDPSLVNNQEFAKNHPALQTYLQYHPAVREEIRENPDAFIQAENRYDRQEDNRDRDTDRQVANQDRDANRDRDPNRQTDERNRDVNRDRDTNRQELTSFDRFLDSHRETAERLRKDPSLVDNQEFVKSHPALQTYLQDHPAVREEIKENPHAFMQEEARYDYHEDAMNRDRRENGLNRDMDRDTMHRHFGEFLGDHSDIALRLSEDPSLVKNQEFIESHPELKEYLSAHPAVKQELMTNPQSFVKSSQQFTNGTATPTAQPKPKQ